MPYSGCVVDRGRDHLLPPVEGPVLLGSIGPGLGRPPDEGGRDEVDGALSEAELGLGVVVWVALHSDTHSVVRSTSTKLKNIAAIGGLQFAAKKPAANKSRTALMTIIALP